MINFYKKIALNKLLAGMFSNDLGKAIRDILMRHSCSGNRYKNTRLLEEELWLMFQQ